VNQIGVITQQQARDLWNTWSLCLAHEMLGGAQHLLDSTVEYTKLRYQFGRAIGSFQSLKHRCADLLMELELAKGVVSDATQSTVSDNAELYLPSMAKAMASDAYMSIAKSAIQLRGGIGFTWENDTHLWFKRAKSSEVFLGTASAHRENVIALIEESGYAA
jgi:alkylation response protein AidB-like acyl-CoA dehydrogenase